jgi:hypothetical protein
MTVTSAPKERSAQGEKLCSGVRKYMRVMRTCCRTNGQAREVPPARRWDLDNEHTWWDAVHRDVHPNPFTYDEVTTLGIGTALAIKTADPTPPPGSNAPQPQSI